METLALLGRECGWTRDTIAELTPHGLTLVTEEVYRQKQTDWWDNSYPVAQLSALTANMHRKKGAQAFKPDKFIGKRPKKAPISGGELDKLMEAAEARGLKVPSKKGV